MSGLETAVEQRDAEPLVELRFSLQGNGFGSSARIEAHRSLHPEARRAALDKGLLRAEWDGPRLRYRRHFSNPLRALQAALHIYRANEFWQPSLWSAPGTAIEVERLFSDMPRVGESKAKRMMLEALPTCAVRGCDGRPVEVHHIHGRTGTNPHRPTNLLTLCRNHHGQVHEGEMTTGDLERLWLQVVTGDQFPTEYR